LLELISIDPTPDRTPESDHTTLRRELERFDATLATRPCLVAFSKIDLPEAREACEAFTNTMRDEDIEVLGFSAATGEGIDALLDAIERLLQHNPVAAAPRSAPLPPPPHRQR
jgi:GTP-binding protein